MLGGILSIVIMLFIVVGLIWMTSFFISLVNEAETQRVSAASVSDEELEENERVKKKIEEWNKMHGIESGVEFEWK